MTVIAPQFVHGMRPQGWVEVDAARMLLILARFAHPADLTTWNLSCLPTDPFELHFASEYYLQKLDFLLRYPAYFVYELTELHYSGDDAASDAEEVKAAIRSILGDQEPELQTIPFRKFWRGVVAFQTIGLHKIRVSRTSSQMEALLPYEGGSRCRRTAS
jgi:hypothetical protein